MKSCSPASFNYLIKIPQVLVERGRGPRTEALSPSACCFQLETSGLGQATSEVGNTKRGCLSVQWKRVTLNLK